jgi:hypothetical protein
VRRFFRRLGTRVHAQAEMRTIRSENALLQHTITSVVTNLMTVLSDRIAQFERSIEERLARIEQTVLKGQ